MTLLRLSLGWCLIALWFLLFEMVEQRLPGSSVSAGRRLRAPLITYLADALVFTLFAALWFASLGAGGWLLLFAVVGLMMEGFARYRDQPNGLSWSRPGLIRLAMGIGRIIGAGGILAWRFSASLH
ncbi:MAG: hypothetical protein ABI679_03385 [Gemmatimonadota bacterium]